MGWETVGSCELNPKHRRAVTDLAGSPERSGAKKQNVIFVAWTGRVGLPLPKGEGGVGEGISPAPSAFTQDRND